MDSSESSNLKNQVPVVWKLFAMFVYISNKDPRRVCSRSATEMSSSCSEDDKTEDTSSFEDWEICSSREKLKSSEAVVILDFLFVDRRSSYGFVQIKKLTILSSVDQHVKLNTFVFVQ